MKKINVNLQNNPYRIIIGENLLNHIAVLLAEQFNSRNIMIVTDEIIAEFYLSKINLSLKNADFTINTCILKSGEEHKSLSSLMKIIDCLSNADISRTDIVAALGGGVISDVTALAASLFLRGIQLVTIPTTLLAAVDAAIGGKTAINLESGKNRMGNFYHPHSVIISTDTFLSLPKKELENGIAEIIKYSMLKGSYITELLHESIYPESSSLNKNIYHFENTDKSYKINQSKLIQLISSCINIKLEIVAKDELDLGIRQLLNLGHTIAHAIEKKSDYSISHGQAVAIGLSAITKAAIKNKLCHEEVASCLSQELKLYSLPEQLPFSIQELIPFILNDKKRKSDLLSVICPTDIGKAEIITLKTKDLYDFLK